MRQLSITPSITVTIGRHTRQYFAFVTTAPAELDSPADGHPARGAVLGRHRPRGGSSHGSTSSARRTPGRLVLVEALELAWQRAKYRGHQHLLLRADPGLVGLNTLQHWLWQRLQAPVASPVAA